MWQYQDRPVVAEQPFNPNRAIYLFWFSRSAWEGAWPVATSFLPFFCEISDKYIFEFSLF